MNKIEFGIDLNKDGHCDLCGKFVDINGQHNNSKNLEQIIKENIHIKRSNLNDSKWIRIAEEII